MRKVDFIAGTKFRFPHSPDVDYKYDKDRQLVLTEQSVGYIIIKKVNSDWAYYMDLGDPKPRSFPLGTLIMAGDRILTRQEFDAGTAFEYHGRFHTAAQHPQLRYTGGADCFVASEDGSFKMWVSETHDDHFKMWSSSYGTIVVGFDQCFVKEDPRG